MASDNGKAGVVDMFDVFMQLEYIEIHYDGTVQLVVERAAPNRRPLVLCHATFVGNEATAPRCAGLMLELLPTAGTLLQLPQRLQSLLFELHDLVDDLPRGSVRLGATTVQ